MAREVIFSEDLCFIKNNFDKLPCSQLKPVLCSFYDDDDLTSAKETLLKAVQQAVGDASQLPRLPRRQGDGKSKLIADDILKLFTIIDERKLSDAVPKFVAEDLNRIPFVNADSINVLALAKKLETMETRLHTVEQLLVKLEPSEKHETAELDAVDDFPPLPAPVNGGHWNTVISKKRRQNKVNDTDAVNAPAGAAGTTQSSYVQQRKNDGNRKVLGTRQVNSSTTITSGVPITQKSVVHIDNLHFNCTKDLLADYLLASDIHVLTCSPSKSWLRDKEKEQVTAFRVCVPASERCKIMDPQLWSEGVLLRDWKFKKSNHGASTGS